jgi:formate hydrogenlyase transcriptional activator
MGCTGIRLELSGAHLGLASIPATKLAKVIGGGKALVEEVARMRKSHHETESTRGPIPDKARKVAVTISSGRENGAIPGHDDKGDDIKKVLNESRSSEPTLQQIIHKIPTLAWCNLPDGSSEFLNQRWHDYTGLSPQEAHRAGWKVAIHPEDLPRLMAKWGALSDLEPREYEVRLRRSDGVFRWFLFRIEPLRDEVREAVRWYGTATDIEDRKRIEALRAAEKRTLEMIADGASLKDILNELCSSIDVEASPVISTVLLMDPDGKRLWHTAGPLVPRAWLPAISPVLVSPNSACCGAAAFSKKRVIVADVATHTNWPDEFKVLAIKNGIRAAWSEPILTKDGEVLGTFALYSSEPRIPTDAEIKLIEAAGHLALIAIERQRSRAALTTALDEIAKSEAELRTITDAIPQLIVAIGADGNHLYANQALLEYTGLRKEEVGTERFREVFHQEDSERLQHQREVALSQGLPFEYERRVRRRDGRYRWLLVQYNPLRDQQGKVIRWYATGTDIDDRKQAEERTRQENVALREQIDQVFMFDEIVGSSPALKTVLSGIVKVAPTDSTVLITGETGTGKELIARAIHKSSQRAGHAFISVNCAAIPSSLIASELFGHEKGAFTGALQRRQGRFELAHAGTIFLDEIGELPAETQIALLRVLQERQFERVGGNRVISTDVRIIAATNRDLTAAIASGTFRADLFYRLNVFPINVPPLRNRREDIPMLVEYFVKRYAEKARKKITGIDKNTFTLCQSYHWPGNIRELQNIVERSIILCTGDIFSIDDAWLSSPDAPRSKSSGLLTQAVHAYEKELIEAALAESNGKVAGLTGAAAKLGIPRSTLELRIKQLNIKKPTR